MKKHNRQSISCCGKCLHEQEQLFDEDCFKTDGNQILTWISVRKFAKCFSYLLHGYRICNVCTCSRKTNQTRFVQHFVPGAYGAMYAVHLIPHQRSCSNQQTDSKVQFLKLSILILSMISMQYSPVIATPHLDRETYVFGLRLRCKSVVMSALL